MEGLTTQHVITLLYGTNIADNRILDFVLPPTLASLWYRGLRRLVRAAQLQRRKQTDKRLQWLKEQYLQLYYENERKQGPTPAEAIKIFGGRKWSAGTSPGNNTVDTGSNFKRTNSVMGYSKTIKKKSASNLAPTKVS